MCRLTFGVSASSFAANMSVVQNAVDFSKEYSLASCTIKTSLYVDDCLTGADSVEAAKWHTSSRNLKTGDMVLLSEDGMIPAKWPLGRVVATYPGSDDVVRVVSVKTATGTYKRPAAKVALLYQ